MSGQGPQDTAGSPRPDANEVMTVQLIGISKKGKERVKQHGSVWDVISKVDPIGQGRWLLAAGKDWRWVAPKGDPHFEMIVNLPV